ncbi:hypothetical protein ABIB90_001102 [Bradyrhizobium sp. JR4.1]
MLAAPSRASHYVSTITSQPSIIADELRRQADVFTGLVELQASIGRNPSERPVPRERESRYRPQQIPERQSIAGPKEGKAFLRTNPERDCCGNSEIAKTW